MKRLPFEKYRPYQPINLKDRTWPNRQITRAPVWCSVDLRDGNQALIDPMTVDQKLKMFKLLVALNFKEIEIGFPAASGTEYQFCRRLIEENLIPHDVCVQVLCQSRDHLIERTFEALQGAHSVIFHLYNSTSKLQREVVFNAGAEEIQEIALKGTRKIKSMRGQLKNCRFRFQYSPESFTGTELDVALQICNAVTAEWGATPKDKIILNLPATVEMSTPNIYADMIEWMHTRLDKRDSIIISIHPHNDRGCAVAASELALMAGGERIEGTLFGNGERTGNVDICTLALNLYSQGVDPALYLGDMPTIMEIVEGCTRIPVHPRHPYAGDLVYTAFSGSHQDAINKGLKALKQKHSPYWEVPYLPIDPHDLNRTYEAVIRINSQSGKGGVSYILETNYGFKMPRSMQVEFSKVIQHYSDKKQKEVTTLEIRKLFYEHYVDKNTPLSIIKYRMETLENIAGCECEFIFKYGAETHTQHISGTGPIDAFFKMIKSYTGTDCTLTDYSESTMGNGSDASAHYYSVSGGTLSCVQ
ncbi:hypothetical protein CHS0354_002030 [Potamilus streckersoni]|uniref:2-isopropylmalate synthase n=1 Tax=Potamilus streckersoni TaxID=2493646 RepID=A0AAE0T5Q4_9BIVA|nr:hypothetical protein CHS0354_002030 [Potamilus streckersoni]